MRLLTRKKSRMSPYDANRRDHPLDRPLLRVDFLCAHHHHQNRVLEYPKSTHRRLEELLDLHVSGDKRSSTKPKSDSN